MTATQIFSFANAFVILGWLLLVLLPTWKFTQTLILKGVVFILAVIYAYLIFNDIGNFNSDSFTTLENVKELFKSDTAVAAGWLHYLSFDLFVGAYIVKQSKELKISRLIYTLILPFSFMSGPIGYLIFVFVKTIKTKSMFESN